jgi:hypothetical protein
VRILRSIALVVVVSLSVATLVGQEARARKPSKKNTGPVSFKTDVFPIIEKNCLPCHAEDNFNPSELSMDDYDKMKTGGKNGPIWVEGKSKESNIVKKLSEKPPFGDRMPLNSKKKIADGKAKWLTEDEIKTIATWIDRGAKNK